MSLCHFQIKWQIFEEGNIHKALITLFHREWCSHPDGYGLCQSYKTGTLFSSESCPSLLLLPSFSFHPFCSWDEDSSSSSSSTTWSQLPLADSLCFLKLHQQFYSKPYQLPTLYHHLATDYSMVLWHFSEVPEEIFLAKQEVWLSIVPSLHFMNWNSSSTWGLWKRHRKRWAICRRTFMQFCWVPRKL